MTGAPADSGIQVVRRVAEVLQLLNDGRTELTTSDVAEALSLSRSTAHRYLVSMAAEGLLERDPARAAFRAGPLLVRFWTSPLGREHVIELARVYMHRLTEELHETSVVSLWGGTSPVVAACRTDTTRQSHVAVRPGSRLPLTSAQGEVFLAMMRDRTVADRLMAEEPLELRQEMDARLQRIRDQGIAVRDGVVDGMRTLAAPVLDERGDIIATLAIVGTMPALPNTEDSTAARALIDTAARLSGRLAHRRM
ncbi:IclR family transcriptional regulator [Patulibacter sp. SYSU D01012]|uniref:IclR family transcriptional regulator n=1 Tax=Patulibacter sp. SYSU D01012 TaxID=2817381 RepID=UPI001B3038CE|nr:IclR family transcriptional regulator [Patulibacter sp. SYSU D01012]